jgi:hypothetical protein
MGAKTMIFRFNEVVELGARIEPSLWSSLYQPRPYEVVFYSLMLQVQASRPNMIRENRRGRCTVSEPGFMIGEKGASGMNYELVHGLTTRTVLVSPQQASSP